MGATRPTLRALWSFQLLKAATVLMLCATLTLMSARAQEPKLWGVSPGGRVLSVVRSGSTIYLGGAFNDLGPICGGGVVVDGHTGALQDPFPSVAGSIFAVISDGRGGWFIGGRFQGVGGLPRSNLAHILSSGRVSPWAPTSDGDVYALALRASVLYIAGAYTRIAQQPRDNLASVDAFTGAVTTWNPGTNAGVFAILIKREALYIGGYFETAGGQVRSHLAAFDISSG